MAYASKSFLKRAGAELNRVLDQKFFLYLLDLEVKRSRRYQNFFCILILKLKELPEGKGGKALPACYQKLAHLLEEEARDSDVLGTLGEQKLAVILPYADMSSGSNMRSRFESNLQYYDFTREGYQVVVEQVCFPSDGTDTLDLIRRMTEPEVPNS